MKTRAALWTVAILISSASHSPGGDWPNWRGPDRNGVSDETGLVTVWSVSGLNVAWRNEFVARATPIVMDGRVCTSGRDGQGPTRQEAVACWDAATGKLLWERRFNVYNTTVPFTRVGWAALAGDPETGNVYAQNVDGQFVALDRTGKTVWEHRLGEEYGRGSGFGGRTLIPVVDDDLVIVGIVGAGWGDIGAPRQRYMAFDKRTGAMRWVSSPAQGPFDDANNQASPTVATIGGRRLMVAGGADGWLYAVDAHTGEPVWRFQVSVRGLNSPPTVDGDVVYAAHSEENPEGGPMGAVVAIDGKGAGDITKSGQLWRTEGLTVGFAGPTVAKGRIYVVDNAANLHALDQKTGQAAWKLNLGTIGRAAPLFADGRLYLTEEVGKMLVVEPGPTEGKLLHEEQIMMVSEGRPAEVWGSVAAANGRLYLTSEAGVFALGKKATAARPAPRKAAPAVASPAAPPGADAKTARLVVVPSEAIGKAGEPIVFEAWGFDDKGRFLRKEKATFSLDGLAGEIGADGKYTSPAGATTAGKVKATLGDLSATVQARFFAPLPWSFDFESGTVPRHWIGTGPRFKITDLDGKRLHKPPQETGLQRAFAYIGPATLSNYTIEADVMVSKQGRRAGDIGLINQGYTLDIMGKKQELQLRTWASELAKSTTIPFAGDAGGWYHMKLRVDVTGDKGVARGKVWKKGEPEPGEWGITLEDPIPVKAGAPGLYGDSVTDLYWDNLSIKVTE